MTTTPQIRKSELNAVRQLLLAGRDEERLAQSLRVERGPLRARVARYRGNSRVSAGAGIHASSAMGV